ncbi:MAG: tetratricopeptide repeat protein [bacterium]|nr:MAG: tetratricopeptide repeat protein [bacterium]
MNRIASLLLISGLVLIFIINCGPKKTKEQLHAEATQFEKQENFKEAIIAYEQLIKDYPHSNYADSILFKIGQIYSNNLSDFESAIDAHKRLIKKYPDSKIGAQSLFMIGYHYANSISDTTKAREYYQKFLKNYAEHELASSVQWELDHLGQDINEIDFLKADTSEDTAQDYGALKPKNTN